MWILIVFKECASCTRSREQSESREWWTKRGCEYTHINTCYTLHNVCKTSSWFTRPCACGSRSRLAPEHHSRVGKAPEPMEEKTVKEESSGELVRHWDTGLYLCVGTKTARLLLSVHTLLILCWFGIGNLFAFILCMTWDSWQKCTVTF